jgi:hypothetical protein
VKTFCRLSAVVALGAAATACVTVALVPGADRIKLTRNVADVSACKAVGNVRAADSPFDFEPTIRNQAVGLGADTVFVSTDNGQEEAGVAYKCR